MFTDPLFEQPLKKIPIEWCAIKGNFNVKLSMEEDRPVLNINTVDSSGNNNYITLGFSELKHANDFITTTELFAPVCTKESSFDLNFNQKYVSKPPIWDRIKEFINYKIRRTA